MSRPSEFTQQVADLICSQLAEGLSLRTVCKAEDMPCKATVFNWMRTYPTFLDQYARAKEESADALVEEIMDIADEGSNDWMESHDKENPGWRANGEAIQRSRLRVDTRKWVASKLKAKKYGEKLESTLVGANGGPIETKTALDVSALSIEQLAALASIKVPV